MRHDLLRLLVGVSFVATAAGSMPAHSALPLRYDFPTLEPYSDFIEQPESGLTTPFCSEWNPDFPFRGGQCCGRVPRGGTNRGGFCSPARAKGNFCDEMTEEQARYIEQIERGKVPDVLALLKRENGRYGFQSFCSPNNGFLAWGRPVVPTPLNGLALKSPHRCTNFGTDGMVGMLEWVGRQLRDEFKEPEYQGARVVVGDVSAPKGGCLKGAGGRRGHSSHTSGQDADIGFLSLDTRVPATSVFQKKFDAKANWWLLKQIFKNPFACVKVVFLDRTLISKLRRAVGDDPEWASLSPRIRHVRNHRNHFHIRIGEKPGAPGCLDRGEDEDEEEEG